MDNKNFLKNFLIHILNQNGAVSNVYETNDKIKFEVLGKKFGIKVKEKIYIGDF